MNRSLFSRCRRIAFALAFLWAPTGICGQGADSPLTIEGNVCDVENRPLTGATVVLEAATSEGQQVSTATDDKGHFQFSKITPGNYRLRVKRSDFLEAVEGPF